MGRTENGGGDQLARGAARVQFRPGGASKTQEEWDAMFADFDREEFEKKELPKSNGKKETATHTIRARP